MVLAWTQGIPRYTVQQCIAYSELEVVWHSQHTVAVAVHFLTLYAWAYVVLFPGWHWSSGNNATGQLLGKTSSTAYSYHKSETLSQRRAQCSMHPWLTTRYYHCCTVKPERCTVLLLCVLKTTTPLYYSMWNIMVQSHLWTQEHCGHIA